MRNVVLLLRYFSKAKYVTETWRHFVFDSVKIKMKIPLIRKRFLIGKEN